ncbi:MAG: DUF1830 domain-containing protein [Aphanocapsa feldmannii 288cV]|nr:MAG: DUF1830 domain-containing protein [Aphanocapsa feldmannii 288cV]
MECSYRNVSDTLVILRCDEPDFYLEKVIFPFDLVVFDAPLGAYIQVWGHGNGLVEVVEQFVVGEPARGSRSPHNVMKADVASAVQAA